MEELDLNSIKAYELDVMAQVHQFCEEHKLTYYLLFGTLLGAIRHNGFIPWDDDIDIAMPRKDYEYFIQHFDLEDYGVYSCKNNKKYLFAFAKAFHRKTVKCEKVWLPRGYEIGVDVDIFPLDEVPFKSCPQREIKLRKRLLYFWGQSIEEYKRSWSPKAILGNILRFFMHGKTNRIAKALHRRTLHLSKPGNYYMVYTDGSTKAPLIYDKAIFAERELHQFESCEFYVCRNYDAFLTQCYGDYMTPPPEDKQVPHHSFAAYRKEK